MATGKPTGSLLRRALVVGVVACWLLGDFAYSRWVLHRVAQWESSVVWEPDGVQRAALPYELGEGRTAVVLVHGFNDSPRAFRFMAPALAARGYTVAVPRLPGFGVRAGEAPEVKFGDWLDAVRGEVQRLRPRFDHVVLVGHSLGGAVVIGLLHRSPGVADAAILLAPAIAVANDRSPVFSARTWHRIASVALPFTQYFFSPFDRNDAVDPAVRNPANKPPFSSRLIVDQAFALMDANRQAAPDVTTPVMMVVSSRDAVVDWRAAQQFYEELGSREKRLHIYDSSAHALPEDLDWQHVVQIIDEYVVAVESTLP